MPADDLGQVRPSWPLKPIGSKPFADGDLPDRAMGDPVLGRGQTETVLGQAGGSLRRQRLLERVGSLADVVDTRFEPYQRTSSLFTTEFVCQESLRRVRKKLTPQHLADTHCVHEMRG